MLDFIKTSKKLAVSCTLVLITLFLVLLVIYLIYHSGNKHAYARQDVLAVHAKMPSFSLPTLLQPHVPINELSLKNKLTLLVVWSSRCRNYQKEHQILVSIAKKLKAHKVNLIGLNTFDNREQALEWLKIKGDPYKFNLFDQQGLLAADLGVSALPELFIIDSYGYIQYRYSGVIDKNIWEQKISPILKMMYLNHGQ